LRPLKGHGTGGKGKEVRVCHDDRQKENQSGPEPERGTRGERFQEKFNLAGYIEVNEKREKVRPTTERRPGEGKPKRRTLIPR